MKLDAALKAKKAWDAFTANHPAIPGFLADVKSRGVPAGTMIDIRIKYEDGTEVKSGIRVKESDLELLDLIK